MIATKQKQDTAHKKNAICNILTAQKMTFSIKDFFSKCDQVRQFTEEILNGKRHFCSVRKLHHNVLVTTKNRFFANETDFAMHTR